VTGGHGRGALLGEPDGSEDQKYHGGHGEGSPPHPHPAQPRQPRQRREAGLPLTGDGVDEADRRVERLANVAGWCLNRVVQRG
jgi:hypothetical protein